MQNRALDDLLGYWDALRRGRPMPARADVDPTEIPHLLPHLLLTDVLPEGRFRYRLVGTEVERSFGTRMTGRCLDELMFGEYLAYMTGLYRRVVDERRPLFSGSRYGSADGGESLLFTDRLMLPLSSDGATVDKVLSIQTFRRASGVADPTAYMLQSWADHDEGADLEARDDNGNVEIALRA